MVKYLISFIVIFTLIPQGESFPLKSTNVYAYVASQTPSGSVISKIDVEKLTIIGQEFFSEKRSEEGIMGIPLNIVIAPNDKIIYVGMDMSLYTIYAIDAKSLKTLRKYFSGSKGDSYNPYYAARWLVISPSGNKLYVGGLDTLGRWVVIDARNFVEIKRDSNIEFGYRFATRALDERYLVTYQYWASGKLVVIDTENDQYVYENPNCSGKSKLITIQFRNKTLDLYTIDNRCNFFLKDSGFGYYLDYKYDTTGKTISQNIEVLDTSTGKIVDSIPFPIEFIQKNKLKELKEIDSFFENLAYLADENGFIPPLGDYGEISVSPDGKYIFWPVGTGEFAKSYIIVIDTESKEVIKRIFVGGGHITNVVFGYE